jgi:hypothetical protein
MCATLEGEKLCILISSTPYFTLSDDCEREYTTRSGYNANIAKRLSIPFSTDPNTGVPLYTNIRCDPVLVCLYREKGSAWCSGRDSQLHLEVVPGYFSEYVKIQVKDEGEVLEVEWYESLMDNVRHFKRELLEMPFPMSKQTLQSELLNYEFGYSLTMVNIKRIAQYKEYGVTLDKEWEACRVRQQKKDEESWNVVKSKKKKQPVAEMIRPLLENFPFPSNTLSNTPPVRRLPNRFEVYIEGEGDSEGDSEYEGDGEDNQDN